MLAARDLACLELGAVESYEVLYAGRSLDRDGLAKVLADYLTLSVEVDGHTYL